MSKGGPSLRPDGLGQSLTADADSVHGLCVPQAPPLALPRRRLGHTFYQGPSPFEPVLQYPSLRIIEGREYYPVW
jgi:hypothetical protein